jgi:uncharacterized peroxidase-related enzyme
MRLAILDKGHGVGTKLLFAFIRAVSRRPVLDIIKLVKYRADFYGGPMAKVTHEAMRGPSSWSVGDRELMAAVVAQANECEFCTKAHAAVAKVAFKNEAKVASVLVSIEDAQLEEPLRATLHMLQKLTREHTLGVADMRAVMQSGVSREQVEDALGIAFSFNTITRLAETFGFSVPESDAMDAGARFLLARGYR